MSSDKTLIVITGPTAVGKTALCLDIARHYDIPIINADSRQVYRELRIGTASPTAEQQQLVRHYLVGTLGLDDYYSASLFEQQVLGLIDEQFRRRDVALLAGGSMMYIDAVCNGIDDIPTIRDDIRQDMKRRYAEEGLEALAEDLRRLDPEHYAVVDLRNPRRVIHALEVCYQTGRTYTSFRTRQHAEEDSSATGQHKARPFRIVKVGLTRPREELYQRINARVDDMMRQGLLDEARALYDKRHLNALNTVGYKELFDYMDGRWPLDEAVERIKGNTRRYARKQLTWFRRDSQMRWFHPDGQQEILNYLSQQYEAHHT